MECISVNEEIFKEKYREYYEKQPNKRPYTSAQLKEIAEEIVKALDKKTTKKTCREYYLIKKYDIVTIEDKTYVVKKSNTANKIIYLTPEEEIFKKLIDVHINCGHGSRDKMMAVIKQNSSIPRPCVEIFLQCCQTCQLKKSKTVAKVAKCQTCSMPIHLSCIENGSCYFCNSRVTNHSNQVQPYDGIKKQAESMITVTKKILPDINVGDCVLVNVDKVDRSPGDPQNIVA